MQDAQTPYTSDEVLHTETFHHPASTAALEERKGIPDLEEMDNAGQECVAREATLAREESISQVHALQQFYSQIHRS